MVRSENFGRPDKEIPVLDFVSGLKNLELLPAAARSRKAEGPWARATSSGATADQVRV